jgi:hypothetical protein
MPGGNDIYAERTWCEASRTRQTNLVTSLTDPRRKSPTALELRVQAVPLGLQLRERRLDY